MSSLFDDLKQGLEEAIDFEKGTGHARVKTYMIMPIKEYTGKEIRDIRMKAGMTQSIFALYMGVSRTDVAAMIPTLLLPFNLIKALLNASLVLLLYKPATTALRKARLVNSGSSNHMTYKTTVITVIVSVVLLSACIAALVLILGGKFSLWK